MLYIVHPNLDTKWPRNDPKTRERVIHLILIVYQYSDSGRIGTKMTNKNVIPLLAYP